MKLVKKPVIKYHHPAYSEIHELAFKSKKIKNIYNQAKHKISQYLSVTEQILSYSMMNKSIQTEKVLMAFPSTFCFLSSVFCLILMSRHPPL
jgi:hypothetical protein